MNKTKSFIAAIALAASAVSSQAVTFTTAAPTASNTGPIGGVWGQSFNVTSPVTVTSLGLRDSGAAGLDAGTSATLGIYVWDGSGFVASSPNLVGIAADNTGLYNAGYSYHTVTHTVLAPGLYAMLSTATTLAGGDAFGDTFNGDALPTYNNVGGVNGIGGGDAVGGSLPLPTGAGGRRIDLVNFQFTPVPEPETYAMIAGLGLVAFGLWRRRQ